MMGIFYQHLYPTYNITTILYNINNEGSRKSVKLNSALILTVVHEFTIVSIKISIENF